MKNYFIMKYEEYREFVKDDAYNWSYAGHKAGSLTTEDMKSEYWECIEWMTEEEAYDKWQSSDEFTGMYSADELCNDMNEAMREYEE